MCFVVASRSGTCSAVAPRIEDPSVNMGTCEARPNVGCAPILIRMDSNCNPFSRRGRIKSYGMCHSQSSHPTPSVKWLIPFSMFPNVE
jgi:hypothetical protein